MTQLDQIVLQAEAELVYEREVLLTQKVKHLLGKLDAYSKRLTKLKDEQRKLEERIKKKQGLLNQIKEGNWEVINNYKMEDERDE